VLDEYHRLDPAAQSRLKEYVSSLGTVVVVVLVVVVLVVVVVVVVVVIVIGLI
jgi:hypothetical protein